MANATWIASPLIIVMRSYCIRCQYRGYCRWKRDLDNNHLFFMLYSRLPLGIPKMLHRLGVAAMLSKSTMNKRIIISLTTCLSLHIFVCIANDLMNFSFVLFRKNNKSHVSVIALQQKQRNIRKCISYGHVQRANKRTRAARIITNKTAVIFH